VRELAEVPPAVRDPNGGESFTDDAGDGFTELAALSATHAAVARRRGGPLNRRRGLADGDVLVAGPLAGPLVLVAACGERAGAPAALDGALLAHLAVPDPRAPCPAGQAPAVTGPSVVVRDLDAGGAVRAVLPVARAAEVTTLALAGGRVAHPVAGGAVVRDAATGAEVTRLAAPSGYAPRRAGTDGFDVWRLALDAAGRLPATGAGGVRRRGTLRRALARAPRRVPGGPTARAGGGASAGSTRWAWDGDALVFTRARRDGLVDVVAAAGGTGRAPRRRPRRGAAGRSGRGPRAARRPLVPRHVGGRRPVAGPPAPAGPVTCPCG
jgi:hypothetical protein